MTDSVTERHSRSLKLYSVISPCTELDDELVVGSHVISEDYLIILVNIQLNYVLAINLDDKARFPIRMPYIEVIECINNEMLLLADLGLPSKVTCDLDQLSEKDREKIEKRYQDIFPLTTDLDSVLRNAHGQKLFDDVIRRTGRSKQYIYDTFYSWLRHGCRKQGLVMPQGKDANRIPKKRNITVKQGAPNKGIAKGKILDENDLKYFEQGKRLYRINKQITIYKTIRQIWGKHYFKSRTKATALERLETGEQFKIVLLPPDERPSYHQFHYWLTQQYGGSLPKRDKPKKNSTEYAANNSGRKGNAFSHAIAPGELFQLDETPFDEEVVSIFDPTRSTKLGKATLYFVRDTFSRAIAGLYVTTQSPSYATAKEAVFNAGRDKAGFFADIGCNLDPELWKIRGVPQALLVDRAEFHNKISEGVVLDLPLTIKLSRGGRGDDKFLAETIFNVFREFFKGLSPALQTKSQRDIALQLARKKACLTIRELYEIAIVFIIHYNNKHVIDGYPLTKEMIRDSVPAIPAKLWDWGLKYRPGYLIDVNDSELYLKLLEKGEVSVHRSHIYLKDKGLHYNCDWTLDEHLQDRRASSNKVPIFPCRYHRGLVDTIFLCTPDGLQMATLDAQDIAYSGLSFEEVKAHKQAVRKDKDILAEAELNSLVSAETFLLETVRNAGKQRVPSSMPNIRTIKDNRKLESVFDRVQQVNRLILAVRDKFSGPLDTKFSDTSAAFEVETHSERDAFSR